MNEPLLELGKPRFVPGYWRGMKQASSLTRLRLTRLKISAACLQRLDGLRAAAFAQDPLETSSDLLEPAAMAHPVLSRVLGLSLDLLGKLGMPVMSGAKVVALDPSGPQLWLLGLPAISAENQAPHASLALACEVLNRLDQGVSVSDDWLDTQVSALLKRYEMLAPAGVNTLRFLQAAHAMDMPWRHVANNVYQFGWGRRSRWLDSSFTDQTSVIASGLARDKVACARVLRNAGLPVPRHQLVSSPDQAVAVAQTMAYPVVVKPANMDRGQGVMADLRHADAVRQAYMAASRLSKRVLVEQHIQGQDYRVRVCNGQVVGVVIRRPATVVGDGVHTVQYLIDKTNAERVQQKPALSGVVEQGVHPIRIDDEVRARLSVLGLDLQSVAEAGQVLQLRGAANVSLGGTTWDVSEQAHADNLELACHAARALRLDVSGIDLLLPDISRSWKETGGAVCEVNAQPQFSTAPAHQQVLARLVDGKGRIPVVGLLGLPDEMDFVDFTAQMAVRDGVRLSVVRTPEQCSRSLLDAQVDAVLWRLPDLSGAWWPVDRLDLLVDRAEPRELASDVWRLPHAVRWAVDGAPDMLDGPVWLARLRAFLLASIRPDAPLADRCLG